MVDGLDLAGGVVTSYTELGGYLPTRRRVSASVWPTAPRRALSADDHAVLGDCGRIAADTLSCSSNTFVVRWM